MGWPEVVFLFAIGAAVGSFLNVCIARLPAGVSIVRPGSHCPSCRQPIKWYDNVPLVSYCLLRGRCRACGSRISPVYPAVEAVSATLAVLVAGRFGLGWQWLAYFAFSAALLAVTAIDWRHQIIPDSISLPGILVGFGYSFFSPLVDPVSSAAGIVLGGGFLALVSVVGRWWYGQDAMGWGDVKLLAMVGAFIGWRYLPLTVLLGSLVGSIIGVATMLWKGSDRRLAIPFGPYLSLGALVSLFWGDRVIDWYMGL